MTDKEQPKNDSADMSVEELVRLKQHLSQSINYGNSNLNARQVTQLRSMDAKQWAKVRKDYHEWVKGMQANVLIVLAATVGGFVVWSFVKSWIGTVGLVCAVFAVANICKREGHREGYVEGYDAGFESGINRTLGISDKEALEVNERATEMEIDDSVVAAFDKKNPHQGQTDSSRREYLDEARPSEDSWAVFLSHRRPRESAACGSRHM